MARGKSTRRKRGGGFKKDGLRRRFMSSAEKRGIPKHVAVRMFKHYKKRGAGFWDDLKGFGSKIFGGIKRGVKWASTSGLPALLSGASKAQTLLEGANKILNPSSSEDPPPGYSEGGGLRRRGKNRKVGGGYAAARRRALPFVFQAQKQLQAETAAEERRNRIMLKRGLNMYHARKDAAARARAEDEKEAEPVKDEITAGGLRRRSRSKRRVR